MVYNWLTIGLSGLFPPVCILCGDAGDDSAVDGASPGRHGALDLCPACRASLSENHLACARCALPLPAGTPPGSVCGHCRRRTPGFDRLQAGFRYQAPIDQLITGLKYAGQLSHAPVLGRLLAERIDLSADGPQLLLPAPLHPRRLRERGFNQAAELTRVLAAELALPWSTGHFVRIRHTEPQAGLDRRARRRNLRRAFRWRGPIDDLSRVAVIDDVVTTGTTAEEMARALKRAGISRVEVWAVARTPD